MSVPKPLNIAYYAPLKPPDHPIPSGDRQMARMLLAALGQTGHKPFLASRYISYSKRPGLEVMEARKQGALAEADRLLGEWEKQGGVPDLWACYHPYDKSPDWLGEAICTRLDIPMITIEPCKTGQGKDGEWLPWREEAQRGIRMADMNLVMTRSDLAYLESFVAPDRISWLNPFIDASLLEKAGGDGLPDWPQPSAVKLLAVGMMRPGAKLASYEVLARALGELKKKGRLSNASLLVVGGGPGEREVAGLFCQALGADWRNFVCLAGEISPQEVIALMAKADILTWPGCREAYGMVYLEAACMALPAVALDNMGVPLVVCDGKSGLLAAVDESAAENATEIAYGDALDRVISNPHLRQRLATCAREFALNERSAKAASSVLRTTIDTVINRHARKEQS